MNEGPSFNVSVSRKINLGEYESQDIYIGVQRVPFDSPPEFIKDLIDQAEVTVQMVLGKLENDAKTALLEAKKLNRWRRDNELSPREIAEQWRI